MGDWLNKPLYPSIDYATAVKKNEEDLCKSIYSDLQMKKRRFQRVCNGTNILHKNEKIYDHMYMYVNY